MLPTLLDLGIETSPVYIRKIDKSSFWNSEDDLELRVSNAVKIMFKNPEHIYSFWRVETNWDFYRTAASLNAGRTSPTEDIHFIWMRDQELTNLGLTLTKSEEGRCLSARKLHYNVDITTAQAEKLCRDLMRSERLACRCRKKQMKAIVEHLTQEGCKVYDQSDALCNCLSSLGELIIR
jgi:hypothetical protein